MSSLSSFRFFVPVVVLRVWYISREKRLHTLFHLIRERKPYISLFLPPFPISSLSKSVWMVEGFSKIKKVPSSLKNFMLYFPNSYTHNLYFLFLYFMIYPSLSSSNLYSYMKNKYNEYQHQLLNQTKTVMVQSYSIFSKNVLLRLNLLYTNHFSSSLIFRTMKLVPFVLVI